MSWAEVKTINSDPSIPLNNLIGTNMRILENTDDRLSNYTSPRYMLYNETYKYIMSNNVNKLKNKISKKVFTDVTLPTYNNLNMGKAFNIVTKNNTYIIAYVNSINNNVGLNKFIGSAIYDANNNRYYDLCTLETSDTYYHRTGICPGLIRISNNRYLVISLVEARSTSSSSSSATTLYKLVVSELTIDDGGNLSIKNIDIESNSFTGADVSIYHYHFQYSACFLSGRHAELVFRFHGTKAASVNNYQYYTYHVLLDLENLSCINFRQIDPPSSNAELNTYFENLNPIYFDENQYVKISFFNTNSYIYQTNYTNNSYSADSNQALYSYGLESIYTRPNWTSYRGVLKQINSNNVYIKDNKLYTLYIDKNTEEYENIATVMSTSLVLENYKHNMYIRCIDSTYDESTNKIVSNITDKPLGNNKMFGCYYQSGHSYAKYYNIYLDDNFSRFIGDDILVMSPFISNNPTYDSGNTTYRLYFNTFDTNPICYRIKDVTSDNPTIEHIDIGLKDAILNTYTKMAFLSVINSIFFETANYSTSEPKDVCTFPALSDNYLAFNVGASSADTSTHRYPAGLSVVDIGRPEDSDEFIQLIKDIYNCINYIKIPVMKGMKIMIEVKDCIIEGDVTIIDNYNIKCNSDGIVYIYHTKDIPYLIAPSN